MNQYYFVLDGIRCIGCKTCSLACKDCYDLDSRTTYLKVYEYEGGSWSKDEKGLDIPDVYAYYVPCPCLQCDQPACVESCPSGAMTKCEETGLVHIVEDDCYNCGMCLSACPYGVPVYDEERSRVAKCDGCRDRVLEGKLPICVESCTQRALDFGTVEEMVAKYPEAVCADVAPLPSPQLTNPSYLVKSGRHHVPSNNTNGFVGNMKEVL